MSDESSSKERKKTFKNFFVEEKDMELADDTYYDMDPLGEED